jgi:folylpolyglutamate synthase
VILVCSICHLTFAPFIKMAATTSTSTTSPEDRTYEEALDALLRSPLHQAKTKEALSTAAARRTKTIDDMKIYMRRIGLLDNTKKRPAVIHVTGTKGKGSTCSLCESILRRHYGWNTGLFTSPHLVDIRERIRVNGRPISQQTFAKVYWEVRTRLDQNASLPEDDPELPVLPGYFRMLTLMALFTFWHYSSPTLDVIILEVGMGGRYDATNILDLTDGQTVVCGVTLLDLDHTRVLGDTLEQIAWEKGGIFQAVKGRTQPSTTITATATATEQFFAIDTNTPGVLAVLRECAEEQGRLLYLVGKGTQLVPKDATMGLSGDHQRINAELAVALCQAVVANNDTKPTAHGDLLEALAQASWPGRCQTVPLTDTSSPNTSINLRLDGSHTPISLQAGLDWFASVRLQTLQSLPPDTCRTILIFNCSHERNPVELLHILMSPSGGHRVIFDKVYFCRADFDRPSAVTKMGAADLLTQNGFKQVNLLPMDSTVVTTWQMTLESIWKYLEQQQEPQGNSTTMANLTVAEALDEIRQDVHKFRASQGEVFIAGSLYIVGSALNAIDWSEPAAEDGLLEL